MNVSINTVKLTRPLYDWEIAMAAPIFGHALQFRQVRVHEFAAWPDQIDDIGRKLKKMDPRAADVHNAITLFNGCNFPVGLPLQQPALSDPEYYKTGWLMHELTHAWQYQHVGIIYLYQSIFKSPTYQYAPAGETVDGALKKFTQDGKTFLDFNREQQGDIVRDYYFYLKQNADVTAWDPYLKEVRLPPPK